VASRLVVCDLTRKTIKGAKNLPITGKLERRSTIAAGQSQRILTPRCFPSAERRSADKTLITPICPLRSAGR
ncbi:hypothetical protein ACO2WT_10155, partial [Ligilactobacillus salivarius]|uniref:hypothetical protein n=1 Tax=Ligilactobacillus salivarius TaxID=1624 RepID=UPI003C0306BF